MTYLYREKCLVCKKIILEKESSAEQFENIAEADMVEIEFSHEDDNHIMTYYTNCGGHRT